MRSFSETGQSTIEAAVLFPVLLVMFGLLLQPAVLLYNRCIMTAAATEGCRLVATSMVERRRAPTSSAVSRRSRASASFTSGATGPSTGRAPERGRQT